MHQHQPLSQRDSFSEEGTPISTSSQHSENRRFLNSNNISRNSSTRSTTVDSWANLPKNSKIHINIKQMSNVQQNDDNPTSKSIINGKKPPFTRDAMLSPIHSDVEKEAKNPIKQNKHHNNKHNTSDDDENESAQSFDDIEDNNTKIVYLTDSNNNSSNSKLIIQTPTNRDEQQKTDNNTTPKSQDNNSYHLSTNPNYLMQRVRIESSSHLTASPSFSQRADIKSYPNKNVDSSSTLRPSEVKQRSLRPFDTTKSETPIKLPTTTPSPRPHPLDNILSIDNINDEQVEDEHSSLKKHEEKRDHDGDDEKHEEDILSDVDSNNPPLQLKRFNLKKKNQKYESDRKKREKKKNKKEVNCCIRRYRNCNKCYTEWSAHNKCCIKWRKMQLWGRTYITTQAWFRYFILICILGNCIFIALEDPTGDENTFRNQMVTKSETVFAAIFTVEMIIKMCCNGLFGNHMDDNNEKDIQKEIAQNEENEKELKGNEVEKEPSKNRINQIGRRNTASFSTEKGDPIHEVQLAEIHGNDGYKLNVDTNANPIRSTIAGPLKKAKTPSISSSGHRHSLSIQSSQSTSTYKSTEVTSSISTEKQQNDINPDKYVGYFRDNWNILDFIIVVTSWIEWLPIDAGSNLTAIRVLRVLRPLRTFTKIKSLKVLIATIIKSLRGLSDVLVLLLFLFVVFAIIGIQMFIGVLHQQCFSDDFRNSARSEWCCDDPTKWMEDENFCVLRKGETGNNDIDFNGCPEELPWCLNIAPNPNGGVTNFDNVIFALLNVFVTISLEGWAAIQYKLMDTGATLCWIYFVLLTFIVGFFAANLCLAVIESVYGNEMEKKHRREKRDGDDEIEREAIEQTERAWKEEKKRKMVIMQSPKHNNTNNGTPIHQIDYSDKHTPTSLDNNSVLRINSFRLPYVAANGQESEFRTKMVFKSKKQKPDDLHYRSQSAGNTLKNFDPAMLDKLDGDIDDMPMHSNQAGLIQTSQELDKLHREEDLMNKRRGSHHKQRSSFKLNARKKVKFQQGLGLGTQSWMFRYRTDEVPKNEVVEAAEIRDSFQIAATDHNGAAKQELPKIINQDNNTPHILSQFSTSRKYLSTIPKQQQQQSTREMYHDIKQRKKYKKKAAGHMSENDAPTDIDVDISVHTDLDIETDIDNSLCVQSVDNENEVGPLKHPQQKSRLSVEVEQRKKHFAKSRHSRNATNTSISHTKSHANQARADIFKVDYKQTGTENFYTSLDRVKTFVNYEQEERITNDMVEYHAKQAIGGISNREMNNKQLVDDLTWGDTYFTKKEKETLTDELRRRAHKAKKKRKENEILARKAILIADSEPPYMQWIQSKDEWVTRINALVVSGIFESVIMMVIVLNTVILSLTWPQQDEGLKNILEIINTVFTFVFILEAILKLIGLGPKAYFMDNWNKFDFIIVSISIIELLIAAGGGNAGNGGGGSAISALRSMRLLRAFRLLGKFDTLRQLFMLVVESMHEVSLLTMVLGIFIFMFAALAMSLFGGKLIALGDRRSGRWRYDNFFWSMVNVFMVISGDSWNEVMYDTVKATNDKYTVIYYVIVVCFGTFVILNLFVAILLSKMGSDESDEEFILDGLIKYSSKMFENEVPYKEQVDRLVMSIERKKYVAQFKDKRSKWKHHREKEEIQGKSLGVFSRDNKFRIWCHSIVHWKWFEISIDILILINCVFLALESPAARLQSAAMFNVADIFFTVMFVLEFILKVIALGAFQQPFRKKRSWTKIKEDEALMEWTDRAYQAVFFMHTLNNKILDLPGLAIECVKSNDGYCIVHLWGQQVLRIVYYEGSFATCYKLADQEKGEWELWHQDVARPTDPELETVLTSFDLTDHHHNAYFASNWNRLDAFVVLVAVLGAGFENVSFLRALRAFRPFRIMVRFKKIKVVLGALLRAIPGLFNTFLFCVLFWFVLSILGVNWFNGLYRHCRIDDEDSYFAVCNDININWSGDGDVPCDFCDDSCIMYNFGKIECDSYPGLIWHISVFNFDDVFQALHALFCVATLSGWNFVMYEAIDSTTFNQALIEDNRPVAAVYFMVVVILCSFFSLNLIVSVVVDNFNTIKAEKDGSAFQTEEQALWVNNQRLLETISLDPSFSAPNHWFRKISFHIVQHDWFDPFIMFCIILNALSMSLEHYNQTTAWTQALKIADIVFVVIFALEATLKIAAYGFKLYIINNWNKFDFIISIVGVVGLLTDSSLGLNVLRLFRVGRLLRLLHQAKTLKMLFWTLIYSIPSLWNIGLLLFVIFFIYAVVGMHILTQYETGIEDEVNANNFWSAIGLLYRVGTEDGWTDVYQSYLEAWPRNERYKIYAYFISFFALGTLVLINLFIAVVLDSFEENHGTISREDKFVTIQIWRDIWSYFDPDAKKQIPVRDFIDILKLTPRSEQFKEKHKIIGPGFHRGDPFETLYKRREIMERTRSSSKLGLGSRWSLKPSNLSKHTSNISQGSSMDNADSADWLPSKTSISRKLQSIYDVKNRKEKLRQICHTVHHADMIKLLLRLRLRVELKNDLDSLNLTCFGKLAKLMVDICNSMGIGSKKSQEFVRKHTTRRSSKLDDNEIRELRKELAMDMNVSKEDNNNNDENKHDDDDDNDNNNDDEDGFDVGNKTWYVSYDDALLALCSEVIGPRLPDGFGMFEIEEREEDEPLSQLRIAEWYTIKYDCYDIFKAVNLAIEQNKQYSEFLPSQHVSDKRQKELQHETEKSHKYQHEFKKIKQQISHNKNKRTQQLQQQQMDQIMDKGNIDIYIGSHGNNEKKQEQEQDDVNIDDMEQALDEIEDDDDNDNNDDELPPKIPMLPKPSSSRNSKYRNRTTKDTETTVISPDKDIPNDSINDLHSDIIQSVDDDDDDDELSISGNLAARSTHRLSIDDVDNDNDNDNDNDSEQQQKDKGK